MILGYRDTRTRDFAAGKRIKAFSGVGRAAQLKLDRLDAPFHWGTWPPCRATGSRRSAVAGRASTASGSTTNGGCVSNGRRARRVQSTSSSSTITRESQMARAAIHPGEQLAEELRVLEVSAAELARQLGVPTNRVTGILNGQRAITGDTALRLGHFFGTSPECWLNLQSLYELRLAERRAGRAIKGLPTLKRRKARKSRQPEHA